MQPLNDLQNKDRNAQLECHLLENKTTSAIKFENWSVKKYNLIERYIKEHFL